MKTENRDDIKINAFWNTIGILTSFSLLAISVIILKNIGHVVGWGMHFQDPIFLMVITVIVILFANNLWGVFEINIPSNIATKISVASYSNKALSAFFSGVVGTLLATPCSAPILSSSIAFAITESSYTILIIYLAIGTGMATPYLLLLLRPGLITFLPKPGLWMGKLKKIFAIILLFTAFWLLYILNDHFTINSMLLFVMLVILARFILMKIRNIRPILFGLAFTLSAILVIAIPYTNNKLQNKIIEREASIWVPFDNKALQKYINNGHTVIVDVTSNWCITCKYNKHFVFETDAFINLVEKYDIILMRADYTLKSKEIHAFMSRHKKFGIPLDVIYNPNQKNGIVLPELLTIGDVISNLR